MPSGSRAFQIPSFPSAASLSIFRVDGGTISERFIDFVSSLACSFLWININNLSKDGFGGLVYLYGNGSLQMQTRGGGVRNF